MAAPVGVVSSRRVRANRSVCLEQARRGGGGYGQNAVFGVHGAAADVDG
jgi:hypothetical protein